MVASNTLFTSPPTSDEGGAPFDSTKTYDPLESFLVSIPADTGQGQYIDANGKPVPYGSEVFVTYPGGGNPTVADSNNITPAEFANFNVVESTGVREGISEQVNGINLTADTASNIVGSLVTSPRSCEVRQGSLQITNSIVVEILGGGVRLQSSIALTNLSVTLYA